MLINRDTFLHSCYQCEVARTRPRGVFKSHLRFEPFLLGFESPLEVQTLAQFETLLKQIIQHHTTALPHYNRNEPITLENVSFFALSFTTLLFDINTLAMQFVPEGLPTLSQEADLQKAFSHDLWSLVYQNIINALKDYATPWLSYVQWRYQAHTPPPPPDYRVKPPVGDSFHKFFKIPAFHKRFS